MRLGRAAARTLVASALFASPMLAVPAPAEAAHSLTEPVPVQVLQQTVEHFFETHPDLVAVDTTTGAVLTGGAAVDGVAAGTAVLESPAVIGVGAFIGGAYAGYYLADGATKVFHWLFGHGGDTRSLVQIGNSAWSFNGGVASGSTHFDIPPDPAVQITHQWWSLHNSLGADANVQMYWDCNHTDDGSIGPPHYASNRTVSNGGENNWLFGCDFTSGDGVAGSIHHVHLTDLTHGSVMIFDWTFDAHPNQQWTVTPHADCVDDSGYVSTVNGSTSTITPGPDLAASVALPACPVGQQLGIGYITGGRPGDDPAGVLTAMPVTRTQAVATGTTAGPSASPAPTGLPGSGSNPDDSPGDSSAPAGSGRSCMGSIWSWNPVDWVYTPVKCALQWAFVPSDSSVASAKAELDGFGGQGLGSWVTAVGGSVTALGGIASNAAGCDGPSFPVNVMGIHAPNLRPLYACSGPLHFAAGVCKVLLSIGIVLYGIRICSKPLLSSFGLGGSVQ